MDYVRPIEALIPDAQGRILGVLTRTTAELNLRTIAELAGLSPTHTSRVLPRLVDLGVVERRDVGTTSLFRLIGENLGARWLRGLSDLREQLLNEIAQSASPIEELLLNATVFGSLARGEADEQSDIDLLLVPRGNVTEDERESIDQWCRHLGLLAGNPVNIVYADHKELPSRLRARTGLWRDIARDGICVVGTPLENLVSERRRA